VPPSASTNGDRRRSTAPVGPPGAPPHGRPGPAHRAGEGAALVAEQRRLGQRRRDRAAVDDHERLLGAGARQVQGLRDQLLAGAGLAVDQHRQIGRRDLREPVEDRAHPGALRHQRAELRGHADRDALGPRRLELELGVADAQLGRVQEVDVADPHVAHERAVAAAEIAHPHALLGGDELDVDGAHLAVVDHDRARRVAPEHDGLGADLDPLGRRRADLSAADLDPISAGYGCIKQGSYLEPLRRAAAAASSRGNIPSANVPSIVISGGPSTTVAGSSVLGGGSVGRARCDVRRARVMFSG
jgi:hypothetical protein